MDAASPRPADYWKQQIERALLAPVRAMRLEYLPLLMVYFAYGAMGLTAVAETFWIKKGLTWTPAELSALAVWLTLPWTVEDGVRRAGRHRAAVGLAAARLRVHRRRHDRGRLHPAVRRRGGLDHRAAPRPALRRRRPPGRDGPRAAGRGRRRHEHGGGAAHQPRRQPARQGRDRPRPRHGAGARPVGAVVRHLRRRRAVGLVGTAAILPDRVPARTGRAVDLRLGRAAGAPRDQRAAADRLAHPRRRPRLRRLRRRCWR